ncbi:hypothetical protein I6M39_03850 [Shewanella algae]|uniref:hypothetical protein n=1 Tax=Shewanella algae TaxID=38313 RepID=UPI001AACB9D8|nr:hypothetical protein [Shewanella algae]MBO2568135.1 hypothetical protein [Shewanella algae]
MSSNSTQNSTRFIKLPNGDAMRKDLIGSCSHYTDHGIILLKADGDKLLWIPEPDNAKAGAMRDEIVAALMA